MRPFPIDRVRREFPALAQLHNGKSRIYMDNPAGTQLPRRVIDAVSKAMVEAASNYGGFFDDSRNAEAIHARAHGAMADFLNAPASDEIVVAQNMTALTLHVSRSIGRRLAAGDEIIVTRMDHEGNVSPWLLLAQDLGLVVRWLPFNRDTWKIEPEDLRRLLGPRTRLLALNYASNLTGSINDVAALVALARAAGALTYVDAVQLAPHRCIDVQALDCDFLVCSAYKFFGPHLGVLWGRRRLLDELPAYKVRCAPETPPGKWESGTPQTELLAGLAACVDYYVWLGAEVSDDTSRRGRIDAAYRAATYHEARLVTRLIDGIRAIPGTTVHGITDPGRVAERVPTVSMTHERKSPPQVAERLAREGICMWSGHNYALEVVRHLGIGEATGVVRIGLAHYNTEEEVDATLAALARALT
ncbi:MAG: cysteine desulfurase-like protein [Candidatus Tectomicrobia bacterium]|nr:cysteine desulfurase-like protein [Candidatus Tectomicrobia bacterium]